MKGEIDKSKIVVGNCNTPALNNSYNSLERISAKHRTRQRCRPTERITIHRTFDPGTYKDKPYLGHEANPREVIGYRVAHESPGASGSRTRKLCHKEERDPPQRCPCRHHWTVPRPQPLPPLKIAPLHYSFQDQSLLLGVSQWMGPKS